MYTSLLTIAVFCTQFFSPAPTTEKKLPITGTWKLLTGVTETGNDIVITDYTKGKSFIKIINDSHFAFFMHETENAAGNSTYSSGGGAYSLKGNVYTEHLEYCSDRAWEGHDFSFTISIKNDTLVQTGREKVEGAGIDRINTEKYVRLR